MALEIINTIIMIIITHTTNCGKSLYVFSTDKFNIDIKIKLSQCKQKFLQASFALARVEILKNIILSTI